MEPKVKRRKKLITWIPMFVFLLLFIYIVIYNIAKDVVESHILGDVGSFVSGTGGTFLTIVATFYIYKTYYSQKRELKAQRKEIRLQKELLKVQQFEGTFFSLLSGLRELKQSISFFEELTNSNREKEIRKGNGVEVIVLFNKEFDELSKWSFGKAILDATHQKRGDTELSQLVNRIFGASRLETIKYISEYLFEIYKNQISHYCRSVYNILKFIRKHEESDTSSDKEEKYKTYADIFQSQLTMSEQRLLFYNFIHFNDESKGEYSTIQLVNHYKFLENVGIENLVDKGDAEFYEFQLKGDK